MPVSCFLFKLGEAKPIEKWSTYIKLEEQTFSSLQRRFTVDGYGGFQEKVRESSQVRIRQSGLYFWGET